MKLWIQTFSFQYKAQAINAGDANYIYKGTNEEDKKLNLNYIYGWNLKNKKNKNQIL